MSPTALKSIGAYALVLVGVAAVVVLSALAIHPTRVNGASPHTTLADARGLGSFSGRLSCSGFTAPSMGIADVRQAQLHAREFLDQQNPSEALARFRSIAAVDPGLPGINLDLSTTLLKLHQTESAKTAINTQIGISECLAQLPLATLEAYCKVQMSDSTPESCRQDLAAIQRSAHFQSALVQMALAGSLGNMPASLNAPETTAAAPSPHKSGEHLLASSRPVDHPSSPKSAAKPAASHPSGRNPLAGGEGTDAALGAYSK